jgi:Uma2 family endonuclease
MTALATQPSFTPDDVLRLEPDALYELVGGNLVEKKMSELANETAGLITFALVMHTRTANDGRVLPEQTFKCFPHDPDLVRRPDVSFIGAARLPTERFSGHISIAPDIAVEVASPNDRIYDLDEKLNDYRLAGVRLVWVVNPELRTVMIYRADGTISRLFDHETLTGDAVLPEFSVKVAELLPPMQPQPLETAK